MTRWEQTLDQLAEDPMQLGRELDWVIKHQLIDNYVAKHEPGLERLTACR